MSSLPLTAIIIPVVVIFALGAVAVLLVINKKNKE
jgi:hypothetical protein